jgi:hypothetical protein
VPYLNSCASTCMMPSFDSCCARHCTAAVASNPKPVECDNKDVAISWQIWSSHKWFTQCYLDPYPTLPAGPRGMCIRGGLSGMCRTDGQARFYSRVLIFCVAALFAAVSFVFVLFDYL